MREKCSPSIVLLVSCVLSSAVTLTGPRAQAQGTPDLRAPAQSTTATPALVPNLSGMNWSAEQEQRYNRLSRAHRGLEIATAASLLLVGVAGTVALANQPTLLGNGRCDAGSPVFGTYGCDGFSILHGMGGVAAAALYTAERSVWFSMPKEPMERRMGSRYTAYKVLGYVHLVGMIMQPVLGLIGADPQVLGVSNDPHTDFARTLKTVHVFNGFLIGATYLTTTILNF